MNQKLNWAALAGVAVFVTLVGCQPETKPESAPTASGSGASTLQPRDLGDKGAPPVEDVSAKTAEIPQELKHDGFAYYGLDRTAPVKMKRFVDDGDAQSGTMKAEFGSIANGVATFNVLRDGALSDMGNQAIEVRKDGVYTTEALGSKLDKPMLELPASLKAGVNWNTKGKFKLATGDEPSMDVTYKVVGVEKLTVGGKAFDTVKLTMSGTMTVKDLVQKMSGSTWLAKGYGAVKTQITAESNGKKQTTTIEYAGE